MIKAFIKTLSKHALIFALIIGILIPATLFTAPKKVEAAECELKYALGFGISIAEKLFAAVTTVPVGNQGSVQKDATESGGTYAEYFADCVFKPLALQLAKTFLAELTQSTVEWINSGFEGSPSFITDTEGFLKNTANEAAGEFILGGELAFLCKPFRAQVKFALALNYSYKSKFGKKAQCTLDDIVGNIDGFVNDFNKGGWNGWFAMTMNPYNNPYGSYLEAKAELDARIGNRQAVELKKLDWGEGFLSYEVCSSPGKPDKITWGGRRHDGSGFNVKEGEANDEEAFFKDKYEGCQIRTPGKIISEAIPGQMGAVANKLALADSLDAVFNALTDQLFTKVIGFENGSGGLLGSSKSKDGKSELDRFVDRQNLKHDPTEADRRNQVVIDSQVSQDRINQLTNDAQPDAAEIPYPPGQNVAMHKLVTASTVLAGHPTEKITNGNKSDMAGDSYDGFISQNQKVANTTDKEGQWAWFKINLERQVTIGRIILHPRPGVGDLSVRDMQYYIEILDRNGAVVSNGSFGAYTQDFGSPLDIPVKAVQGLFVRVRAEGKGRLEVAELEIYPYEKPRIIIKGKGLVTISKGTPYNDDGATAMDSVGAPINPPDFETINPVDINTPGTYTITYKAKDSNGAVSIATRQVIVQ
jgi:hypothetical protein